MSTAIEIKIRGFHLDLYGHVNNARYLEFFEDARWAWVDEHFDPGLWEERGLAWIVARITVNFRRPATMGDVLTVDARLTRLGGKTGVIEQLVHNKATGELVADAEVTFVVIDREENRAVALDGPIRRALERALEAGKA